MAGKGDKPRPTKKSQYNANYELINWDKKLVVPKQTKKVNGKTVYVY
jgi:hypothetical protein